MSISYFEKLGVVVIGRNEGKRLQRCFNSLDFGKYHVIYVDSGSTDDSVNLAKSFGAHVVQLNMEIPFTAARARNAGVEALNSIASSIEYVQFLDGDCELHNAWLAHAIEFLYENNECAAVSGVLQEKHPERSIYNYMCDKEWNSSYGEVDACGGIVLMNLTVYKEVGGFNENFIASEEPDLCFRIRKLGWTIFKIKLPMASHDANILTFKQWWKRCKRNGYAFALLAFEHLGSSERIAQRQTLRPVLTTFTFLAVLAFSFIYPYLLTLYFFFFAQVLRTFLRSEKKDLNNAKRAMLLLVCKVPESIGVLKFLANNLFKRQQKLIEYK